MQGFVVIDAVRNGENGAFGGLHDAVAGDGFAHVPDPIQEILACLLGAWRFTELGAVSTDLVLADQRQHGPRGWGIEDQQASVDHGPAIGGTLNGGVKFTDDRTARVFAWWWSIHTVFTRSFGIGQASGMGGGLGL